MDGILATISIGAIFVIFIAGIHGLCYFGEWLTNLGDSYGDEMFGNFVAMAIVTCVCMGVLYFTYPSIDKDLENHQQVSVVEVQ